MQIDRRALLAAVPAVLIARGLRAETPDWPERLIAAGEAQLGVTTVYDPAYISLAYPGGDVAPERGVCTDVVVRAYRAAFGLDLQRLVHEDMIAAFPAYPKTWGGRRPDRNIDHRRVPNLETFFRRRGAELSVSREGSDYRTGELVTQRLPGELPHIAIVTARRSADGARPLLLHNIGAGARIEDTLFAYRIVGRFRYPPNA